jgi:hypothetical protein
MVETGTLYGSPLNALGAEALGGQSFVQAFIIGYFPLTFINGADAVFCFFLCLALIGSVAFGRPALGPPVVVGALAIFLIDPQYVNISSLYSTGAIIAALVIVRVDPREGGAGNSAPWRQAAAPALFYAGAIALKPTSCVFVGLQFGAATAATAWTTGDWRARLVNAGQIAALSAVFLAPWLLLYSPYYVIALTQPIQTPLANILAQPDREFPEMREWHDLLLLLSPKNTFYGAPDLGIYLPRRRLDHLCPVRDPAPSPRCREPPVSRGVGGGGRGSRGSLFFLGDCWSTPTRVY